MATKTAADMPTLSLLYKTKKLVASPPGTRTPQTISCSSNELPTPSKQLNDRIALYRGDITALELDAIVNAANESLLGGGGVDGAIHRAAGRGLLRECEALDGCDTGSAKITGAYDLPCKKVIHAVGPIYKFIRPHVSERDLTGCYLTSLDLAVDNGCRTVAFSAISTGVYGYPSIEAAPVVISAVRKFLESAKGHSIDLVVFVVFEKKDLDAYTETLPLYFPPVPEVSDSTKAEGPSADDTATNPAPESSSKTDEVLSAVPTEAQEEAEAEKVARDLPDVPQTDPSAVEGPIHVDKKLKQDT